MKKIPLILSAFLLAVFCCGCGVKSVKTGIQSAEDLVGKSIGVQSGTAAANRASEIGASKVSIFSDAESAASALNKGTIDAFITDLAPAKQLLKTHDNLEILSNRAFEPEEYAVAVKKGNTELLGIIDVVLEESDVNGVIDNLSKGFINTPASQRANYITGEQTGASGTLTVAVCANVPPFAYLLDDNLTVAGFDIELAKLIAKKVDKTLVVLNMDFDDLLPALENGTADFAISALTVTPEKQTTANFSNTYYTSTQAIVVKTAESETATEMVSETETE